MFTLQTRHGRGALPENRAVQDDKEECYVICDQRR